MKTIECLKLYDNNNSNLIIQYLEYSKLYKSKATIQIYSSCIKRFYDFLFFYYDNRPI
ncbi:bacteriophage-associated integrase XerDC family protein [Brachyspira pilosicoli]|nr:bacteriophage-associated integrase XerDC family protein [Brachyspira pilosicoli]